MRFYYCMQLYICTSIHVTIIVFRFPVAVVLCDVLKATNREKVQRIILATFRVSLIPNGA